MCDGDESLRGPVCKSHIVVLVLRLWQLHSMIHQAGTKVWARGMIYPRHIGIVTMSPKDRAYAQTREFACSMELLPQVIARGESFSHVSSYILHAI